MIKLLAFVLLGIASSFCFSGNATNSFMSYSTTRQAVPVSSDIQRLVNGYR